MIIISEICFIVKFFESFPISLNSKKSPSDFFSNHNLIRSIPIKLNFLIFAEKFSSCIINNSIYLYIFKDIHNILLAFSKLELSFLLISGRIAQSYGATDNGHFMISCLSSYFASIIAPTNLDTPIP